MKFFAGFMAVAVSASCLAAEPAWQWDFETWNAQNNRAVSKNKRASFYGVKGDKTGFNGTSGMVCSGKERNNVGGFIQCQNWKEFTFEMKFKLDKGVDAQRGNALMCYAKHSWNRAQFLLEITSKKQLRAKFTLNINGKKASATLTSEPQDFAADKWYTVRVASASGRAMKIWLDGKLVATKEKESMGFNDLVCKSPAGYPLFVIGSDMANISSIHHPMNGVADDVKLWNTFEEPTLNDQLSAGAEKSEQDFLLLKEGKMVISGKFNVLDRPSGALGGFIRPEQKFLDAAAHAEAELTASELIVAVVCPFAEGMKPDKSRKMLWNGESVEFFFAPSPEKTEYFQYALNLTGPSAAIRYRAKGTVDKDFKSAVRFEIKEDEKKWTAIFTIPRKELGIDKITSGQQVKLNFTRSGKTGGGLSTWSSIGNNFHDIAGFNTAVFGSLKDSLKAALASSRGEFEKIGSKSEDGSKVAGELDNLTAMVEGKGDNPAMYGSLRKLIDGMQLKYTALRFAATPALIWTPALPWDNNIQVSSLSKKTEKIALTLSRNSYTYTSVVFSNMSGKPFLGQLKCFTLKRRDSKKIYNYFNSKIWDESKNELTVPYKNLAVFETIPVTSTSGSVIYDALSPLPMNTVVKAAPGETKQLWLRFSSADMSAGLHKFVLCLKPSMAGFPAQEIELAADIRPVDASTVKLNSSHYTNIYQRGANENLVRFLAEKGTNIIYTGCFGQASLDVYPEVDKSGNVVKFNDYAQIDDMIDKTIRHGIAKEDIKLWAFLELGSYGLRRNGKRQLKFNTPEWRKAFKAFLADFTGHLEKKYGITKERIIFYPVDEPDGDINNPKSRMYQAYLEGSIIKEADKAYRTLSNPHPSALRDFKNKKDAFNKFIEVFDIFELYRPGATPEIIKWAQESGKEIWTYGIYGKTVTPDVYRREYWQSLRDGFTEVVTYWHLESHAGGDGFNGQDGVANRVDYGSIYADLDMGTVLTSRRQEAHDLGCEDFRLGKLCLNLLKKKNNPALKAKFDAIVKKAADGDMQTMENARLELLKMAEELQK